MSDFSVDELLRQGKRAANQHQNEQARRLLSQVVQRDPDNEQGWLWLSGVVDSPEKVRYCLERVLAINPHNPHARAAIDDFAHVADSVTKRIQQPTQPQATVRLPIQKPARQPVQRTVRPRPSSMIEGSAVQTVVQQQVQTTWLYIVAWCVLVGLNILLFRTGSLVGATFWQAITRVLIGTLIAAALLLPAWWLLLNSLVGKRHGNFSRPTIYARLTDLVWRSALFCLVGTIVGALGAIIGDPLTGIAMFTRLCLLGVALIVLVNALRQPLTSDQQLDRAATQRSQQALMFWLVALAVGAWLAWGFV